MKRVTEMIVNYRAIITIDTDVTGEDVMPPDEAVKQIKSYLKDILPVEEDEDLAEGMTIEVKKYEVKVNMLDDG